MSLGGSQPLCGHHPGTSPLPLTPGAAGAPTNPSTPNTLLPPPRGGTVRLRALCASFFADEETEPNGTWLVRVETQPRAQFQAICVHWEGPWTPPTQPEHPNFCVFCVFYKVAFSIKYRLHSMKSSYNTSI